MDKPLNRALRSDPTESFLFRVASPRAELCTFYYQFYPVIRRVPSYMRVDDLSQRMYASSFVVSK